MFDKPMLGGLDDAGGIIRQAIRNGGNIDQQNVLILKIGAFDRVGEQYKKMFAGWVMYRPDGMSKVVRLNGTNKLIIRQIIRRCGVVRRCGRLSVWLHRYYGLGLGTAFQNR